MLPRVETVETVETAETVKTVTHSLSDNLKARDASVSENQRFPLPVCHTGVWLYGVVFGLGGLPNAFR